MLPCWRRNFVQATTLRPASARMTAGQMISSPMQPSTGGSYRKDRTFVGRSRRRYRRFICRLMLGGTLVTVMRPDGSLTIAAASRTQRATVDAPTGIGASNVTVIRCLRGGNEFKVANDDVEGRAVIDLGDRTGRILDGVDVRPAEEIHGTAIFTDHTLESIHRDRR